MSDPPKPKARCWCFAWFAAPPPRTASDMLGLLKSSKWQHADVIRIAFLDGTDEQKALVKRFAVGWIDHLANLEFSWDPEPAESHVRITFKYPGSWSVIGMTCKETPKDRPP